MFSIILTAWKEKVSVRKAIDSIIAASSEINEEVRIIQLSPDNETLDAGKQEFEKNKNNKISLAQIQDPQKGKPFAINLAKGEIVGDFIFFTDGDVYIDKNSIKLILEKFKDSKVGGVSGHPISIESKNNKWGYYSHLFTSAIDLNRKKAVHEDRFYPMSGYLMAVRAELFDFMLPEELLVDDAYISYMIYNKGFRIDYADKSYVYVSYPKNQKDYLTQKIRSTGGYIQLGDYSIVKGSKVRGLKGDISLFFYPLKFARNLKEFYWSMLLYPLRAYLWLRIYLLRIFMPSQFIRSWKRVESSKS